MKLEICSPPLWQNILSWTVIAINGGLAIYNLRTAMRHGKVLAIRLRLMNERYGANGAVDSGAFGYFHHAMSKGGIVQPQSNTIVPPPVP